MKAHVFIGATIILFCMSGRAHEEEPPMSGSIGPAWTYDPTVEKPAGEEDMGSWTAAVFTDEQQQRLGVDKFGEPAVGGDFCEKVIKRAFATCVCPHKHDHHKRDHHKRDHHKRDHPHTGNHESSNDEHHRTHHHDSSKVNHHKKQHHDKEKKCEEALQKAHALKDKCQGHRVELELEEKEALTTELSYDDALGMLDEQLSKWQRFSHEIYYGALAITFLLNTVNYIALFRVFVLSRLRSQNPSMRISHGKAVLMSVLLVPVSIALTMLMGIILPVVYGSLWFLLPIGLLLTGVVCCCRRRKLKDVHENRVEGRMPELIVVPGVLASPIDINEKDTIVLGTPAGSGDIVPGNVV